MPSFDVVTELFYDGVWNNISADVRVPAGVNIDWGRTDGAGGPQPSVLGLTINNTGGKYSPRNPVSPLSGKIGRNTQIRVTIAGDRAFTGEVSNWPPRWDIAGRHPWIPIQAAGVSRRINTGTDPASSGLKDFYLGTTPITYWPLTDGPQSTFGAQAAGTFKGITKFGQTNNVPNVVTWGAGELTDYLSNVLRINDTNVAAGQDFLSGLCFGTDATPDSLALEFVYRLNESNVDPATIQMAAWNLDFNVYGTALVTFDRWTLEFRADGVNNDIRLNLTTDTLGTPSTTNLADSVALAAVTDGQLHHVRLQLTVNGANVDYTVYVDGSSVITGTRSTHTLRDPYGITVYYDRTSTTDWLAFGHLIVWENLANIPTIGSSSLAAAGYAGEAAGRRIERLCGVQGVAFSAGAVDLDNSQAMGLQYEDQFSGQLAECEQTDMGLLYEQRTTLALGYRTRASLYAQTPVAVIDYERGELSPPLEPTDDDQTTRNDVFAQRREGGSARATVTTGPLSVLDPPNGVGRYKDEYQTNVQTDGMLDGIAAWRVRLGTVDAARFPTVTVNRSNPAVAASLNNLSTTVRAVNVGDLIRIKGGPKLRAAAGVYDDIDLLVLGGSRFCNGERDEFTFNCVPYEPYAVAKFDTDRYDTAGSTLTAGVAAAETSLSVASSLTLWTTDAPSFPFDITVAGERMTVTNITGATSPQTFTVTRSVNGVSKAQASGATVRLFKTPRYGL